MADTDYACPYCGKDMSTPREVNEHMNSEHPNEDAGCEI